MSQMWSRVRGRSGQTPFQPDTVAVPETAVDVLAGRSTDQAIALVTVLPRRQAEAVLLWAVMGLDAKQAGRVLGITAPLVRAATELGLRTLARHAARPATPP